MGEDGRDGGWEGVWEAGEGSWEAGREGEEAGRQGKEAGRQGEEDERQPGHYGLLAGLGFRRERGRYGQPAPPLSLFPCGFRGGHWGAASRDQADDLAVIGTAKKKHTQLS